jgi:hypothetical protein
MTEAFFVKLEETCARDPQVLPFFRCRIDFRSSQRAAID